jgi:hypothetical protein
MRALAAGERESPRMPLADTLAVLEALDAVRAASGGPPAEGTP